MHLQDKVPAVHTIRVGRGDLMRVRKSPKKELVGSWIRGVVLFVVVVVNIALALVAFASTRPKNRNHISPVDEASVSIIVIVVSTSPEGIARPSFVSVVCAPERSQFWEGDSPSTGRRRSNSLY